MQIDKTTLDKIKPWTILAVICTLLAYILLHATAIIEWILKLIGLCSPLFYAIGIAYVLNQPMSWIESILKKKIQPKCRIYKHIRGISIFLTLILALILIIVLMMIVIPQLVSSSVLLISNLVSYIENIVDFINDILTKVHLQESLIQFNPQELSALIDHLTQNWQNMLKTASNWVGGASQILIKNTVAIGSALANVFTGLLLSLYLLGSKEIFIVHLRKLIAAFFPASLTKRIYAIGTRANDIFSSFISGQLLEACILGSLIYIGMRLFNIGVPFELLISVIVAVTSIVPIFGALFAMAFGVFLILAVDPLESLLFIIFFQVVQQLEGNLIYPHVVGKSVGLPAIWVLLSIVVFGGLFGIIGMLVAVPTTALIYSLIKDFIQWRLDEKNIQITLNSIVYVDKEKDTVS